MKKPIIAILLLLCVSILATMRNSVPQMKDELTVEIHGPYVDPISPPKVPERPYTLLSEGLKAHHVAEEFVIHSGGLGANTEIEYNRRRKTLKFSYYLLDEDFHTSWESVTEKTIAMVASAEKKGNRIVLEKDGFRIEKIGADDILKKHGAREIENK